MQTIGKPVPSAQPPSKSVVIATALHLILLAAIVHRSTPWIAPVRLPGTEQGHNLVLAYLPGRAPGATTADDPKTPPQLAELNSPLPTLTTPKPQRIEPSPNTNSPASDHPDSATGADALGSGNIDIARLSFFPTPKPDLSTLPHGSKGDVIIDIVIDATGKISDLKMTSGLGYGIDETVIATVQQWTFHPATRNGQPVASEQELHFHYERG
jgi:periplasmic protein TonB